MAKTRRMIAENLKDVDVVFELLDARIPQSSENPEIAGLTAGKPRLTLLSKTSLADPLVTENWKVYFHSVQRPCIFYDCRTGEGISEIAPAHLRGRMVALNQFAIFSGQALAFISNHLLVDVGGVDNWRWMLGVMTIPCVLFIVCLLFVPESPRWLVTNRNEEQALKILSRINPPEQARAVVEEIRYSVGHGIEGTFRELFRGKMFRLLMIGIMLSVFQQVTGINVMMYYAPDVFKSTGMGNDSAIYYTMIMGLVNLIFVTISILVVDKVGRRKLMIIGPAGMGLFLFCISGAYFSGHFTGLLSLVLMMGYLAFFALSLGPIVWVLLGEIFPNRIRSRAVSISILAQWAANFLVSFTFPILKQQVGSGFTFLIYAVMCVACVVFVCRCIVETKGKTLEQIEKEFLG